jgi:hypothetical protein
MGTSSREISIDSLGRHVKWMSPGEVDGTSVRNVARTVMDGLDPAFL